MRVCVAVAAAVVVPVAVCVGTSVGVGVGGGVGVPVWVGSGVRLRLAVRVAVAGGEAVGVAETDGVLGAVGLGLRVHVAVGRLVPVGQAVPKRKGKMPVWRGRGGVLNPQKCLPPSLQPKGSRTSAAMQLTPKPEATGSKPVSDAMFGVDKLWVGRSVYQSVNKNGVSAKFGC